jgi:hypothetical protein
MLTALFYQQPAAHATPLVHDWLDQIGAGMCWRNWSGCMQERRFTPASTGAMECLPRGETGRSDLWMDRLPGIYAATSYSLYPLAFSALDLSTSRALQQEWFCHGFRKGRTRCTSAVPGSDSLCVAVRCLCQTRKIGRGLQLALGPLIKPYSAGLRGAAVDRSRHLNRSGADQTLLSQGPVVIPAVDAARRLRRPKPRGLSRRLTPEPSTKRSTWR